MRKCHDDNHRCKSTINETFKVVLAKFWSRYDLCIFIFHVPKPVFDGHRSYNLLGILRHTVTFPSFMTLAESVDGVTKQTW